MIIDWVDMAIYIADALFPSAHVDVEFQFPEEGLIEVDASVEVPALLAQCKVVVADLVPSTADVDGQVGLRRWQPTQIDACKVVLVFLYVAVCGVDFVVDVLADAADTVAVERR